MFEPTSRYSTCEDVFLVTRDGKTIKYKKRRFIQKEKENQTDIILETKIVAGDRIDLISFKYFADPEQFWRLCDMNGVMHPLDLTTNIGKTIKITSEK
jgi:hypothetical protein